MHIHVTNRVDIDDRLGLKLNSNQYYRSRRKHDVECRVRADCSLGMFCIDILAPLFFGPARRRRLLESANGRAFHWRSRPVSMVD